MTITTPIANTYEGHQWVKADEYMTLLREYHRMRLTDEEREAVEWAAEMIPAMAHPSSCSAHIHAATLRSLLERTK